jgi:hypothetical protein
MPDEFSGEPETESNGTRAPEGGSECPSEPSGDASELREDEGRADADALHPGERRRQRAFDDYIELSGLESEHIVREAESRALLKELWDERDGVGGRFRAIPKLGLVVAMIVVARLGRLTAAYGRRSAEAAMTRRPRSEVLFERGLGRAQRGEQKRRSAKEHFQEARRAGRWVGPLVVLIVGGVIWGGLITASYLFFSVFDTNYFRWFLENGALIAIVFGFVSLAIDLDRNPSLVSADPLTYLLAAFTLWQHVVTSWRLVIEGGRSDVDRWPVAAIGDMLLAAAFSLAATVAVFGWFVVIAPLQYLLTLICGAPARLAIRSPQTSSYDPTRDEAQIDAPLRAKPPANALVVGYAGKPVSLTAAVQSALLWTINLWV